MKHSRALALLALAAASALPMTYVAGCGGDPVPAGPAGPFGTAGADATTPPPPTSASGDGGAADAAPSAVDGAPGDASGKPLAPDGSVTGVDVSAALGTLAAGYARAACARAAACCSAEERDIVLSYFNTPRYNGGREDAGVPPIAQCEAEVARRIGSLLDRYAASLRRGRMSFDEARAQKCVDDIATQACGPALLSAVVSEACLDGRRSEVFRKLAPTGSPCERLDDGTLLGECDPAAGYCQAKLRQPDAGAECVAWRKENEPCGLDRDAGVFNFCNTMKGAYCEPSHCTRDGRVLALGEACGSERGAIDSCGAGTYCGGGAGAQTCVPRKADGVECNDPGECATAVPFSCARADGGTGFRCGYRGFCGGPAR